MSATPLDIISGTTSGGSIQSAIARASQKTGIDFSYLMGQAQLESGMRADARAGTSSASGLYQFIEQSWLGVVKQHGAEHGLGWAADSIRQTGSGRMTVSDPATRRAILALRNDPATASVMAAEHASDNKAAIEGSLGRNATGTDLYMAHFLGLGGARSFLGALEQSPGRIGAAMFPSAAQANRNVFYASNGQPRTLSQIYDRFAAKLGQGSSIATANPVTALAAQAFDIGDATVIPGADESANSASAWAKATLDRFSAKPEIASAASVLRPTPKTARLAYMMLASLGA